MLDFEMNPSLITIHCCIAGVIGVCLAFFFVLNFEWLSRRLMRSHYRALDFFYYEIEDDHIAEVHDYAYVAAMSTFKR